MSVSHYALDINGAFREAVPVDKNKGTEAFEAIETVMIDPSILTKSEQGNSFKTRIFPIFPNGGIRKILIGYQEELDLNDKNEFFHRIVSSYPKNMSNYSLNVNIVSSNKPRLIDDFTGELFVATKTSSGFSYSAEMSNGAPNKSISIHFSESNLNPKPTTTYTNGNHYFYGYVEPKILPNPATGSRLSSVCIIWDTSLSCKGRNTDKEFKLLDDYFRGKKVEVEVYLLGYYFQTAKSFNVNAGNWNALKVFLQKVLYDGGTKFSEIRLTKKFGEVLFFTDGISSLDKAGSYQFRTGQTVHCINSLQVASHDFLNYLAIKHAGSYVDLTSLSSEDAARLLSKKVTRFQGIDNNSNVDQVYPLAGTPVSTRLFSLVGKVSNPPQTITLKFGPSADSIVERIKLTITENPNESISADKLWAQKAITSLEHNYEDNKNEVDGLGTQFGIATKGTSLIVLENLNDYFRFGIVPPAELRQ